MIPQAHKIITEITIGYLTMPFPVGDSERRMFLLMIPIIKQNGLI